MPKLLLLLGLSLSFFSCQEPQYLSTNEVFIFNQCALRSTEIINKTIQADLVDLKVNNFDKPYYQPILEKVEIIKQSTKSVYDSLCLLQQQMASLPLGTPITKEQLARFQALEKSAHRLPKQNLRLIYEAWDHGGIKYTIFADTTKRQKPIQALEANLNLITLNTSKKDLSIITNSVLRTTLGILQQNIKQSEVIFISFLLGQSSKMRFCDFGGFFVASNSSKTCIRLGETYETAITILEQMPHDSYELIVEGDTLEMINDRSTYSISPQAKGEQCFRSYLVVKNPLTGKQSFFYKPFYFEVSP